MYICICSLVNLNLHLMAVWCIDFAAFFFSWLGVMWWCPEKKDHGPVAAHFPQPYFISVCATIAFAEFNDTWLWLWWAPWWKADPQWHLPDWRLAKVSSSADYSQFPFSVQSSIWSLLNRKQSQAVMVRGCMEQLWTVPGRDLQARVFIPNVILATSAFQHPFKLNYISDFCACIQLAYSMFMWLQAYCLRHV